MIQLFLIQLVGHMLGDFYFQGERMCTAKKSNAFGSIWLYVHTLLIFCAAWFVTWNISFGWAALLIALLHGLVDGAKSYIPQTKCNPSILFFIDQIVHLLIVFGVVWLFVNKDGWIEWEWLSLYRAAMISAVMFCLWSANFFIGNFLKIIKVEKTNDDKCAMRDCMKPTLDASRVIGSIERMLVFLFVWLGQYSAIGFLIAAKSVMRFPEMGQGKNNAEYYLVGSLLSFGLSIMLTATIIALHSKGLL